MDTTFEPVTPEQDAPAVHPVRSQDATPEPRRFRFQRATDVLPRWTDLERFGYRPACG
jgi:hypothetical protein